MEEPAVAMAEPMAVAHGFSKGQTQLSGCHFHCFLLYLRWKLCLICVPMCTHIYF